MHLVRNEISGGSNPSASLSIRPCRMAMAPMTTEKRLYPFQESVAFRMLFGRVAQSVEHHPYKVEAQGSSPCVPMKSIHLGGPTIWSESKLKPEDREPLKRMCTISRRTRGSSARIAIGEDWPPKCPTTHQEKSLTTINPYVNARNAVDRHTPRVKPSTT